ncbi:MAG TPA: hypothetical protein VIG89_08320 [Candidatus Acidoferrales bacterium]
MGNLTGVRATLGGAAAIAVVSTLGDFIWATWIPRHRVPYGLTHGAALFLCVGLFLGTLAGKRVAGALGGALIGFAAAGSFYLLAPVAGRWSMFVAWFGVWTALGLLNERLEQGSGIASAVARGVLAAVVSGAAFYLISGIWRPFNPQGWDYLVHFGAWMLAYLPGFAALLVARPR